MLSDDKNFLPSHEAFTMSNQTFKPPQMFFNADDTINKKISTINRIYINFSIVKCGDFERRNAEETTYEACDGPSCL